MGDDGAAVSDELFDIHGSLGFHGLETQDLNVGDAVVVDVADRRISAVIQMSTVQGQPVIRIGSVTPVESRVDGLHLSLIHI